jgi:hypothetical protein
VSLLGDSARRLVMFRERERELLGKGRFKTETERARALGAQELSLARKLKGPLLQLGGLPFKLDQLGAGTVSRSRMHVT